MNNLNYLFFDEFKRVDKICKEIYGVSPDKKLGVTMYLDDMEAKNFQGTHRVPSWSSDYNHLKKVRNIRNELVHSDISFNYQLCTQDDVDFVRSFYSRLLSQTDPLALLHKQAISQKNAETPQKPTWHSVQHINPSPPSPPNVPSKNSHPHGCLSVVTILIVILCVILILI
jgi:hypothetical protein